MQTSIREHRHPSPHARCRTTTTTNSPSSRLYYFVITVAITPGRISLPSSRNDGRATLDGEPCREPKSNDSRPGTSVHAHVAPPPRRQPRPGVRADDKSSRFVVPRQRRSRARIDSRRLIDGSPPRGRLGLLRRDYLLRVCVKGQCYVPQGVYNNTIGYVIVRRPSRVIADV